MKKAIKLFCSAVLVVTGWAQVQAQDAQLTQFYAAPMYLNPAMAGNLDYFCDDLATRFRGNVTWRRQWDYFQTQVFSADFLFPKDKVGLGVQVFDDRAGNSGLRNFNFSSSVSYKLAFPGTWRFHSGLQFGVGSRSINNWNQYSFPDQFNNNGFTGVPSGDAQPVRDNVIYPTVALGGLVFNSNFYFGLSAFNVNTPNASFMGGSDPYPMRMSAHTGFRFSLRKLSNRSEAFRDLSIMPNIQVRRQRNTTQADIGMYINNEPLIFGVWYRGLPMVKNAENTINQDAFALLLGYKQIIGDYYFKIAYSHDVNISRLGYSNGVAHEITFSMQFIGQKCQQLIKNRGVTPCPTY